MADLGTLTSVLVPPLLVAAFIGALSYVLSHSEQHT
jgi:hypothetical protein